MDRPNSREDENGEDEGGEAVDKAVVDNHGLNLRFDLSEQRSILLSTLLVVVTSRVDTKIAGDFFKKRSCVETPPRMLCVVSGWRSEAKEAICKQPPPGKT